MPLLRRCEDPAAAAELLARLRNTPARRHWVEHCDEIVDGRAVLGYREHTPERCRAARPGGAG